MRLSPGSRLGPYEVVADAGAGGMGEIYRGRDSRLGREVAIKVLPERSASDPQRRARFEQEARAASALNHPNVVTIYEIGVEGDTVYIAMELVEGKTLRELLEPGPLPTKKLLEIAVQVADGLARAHEAGILHRDLKPANVMVSDRGLVKILDFGLAKLTTPSSDPALHTPPLSASDLAVGTAGYMSPEQANGQPVDARSDQFAFGALLYEMATGRPAFGRKTVVESQFAILREEPEQIESLNPAIPAPFRWIVEACLAKDPKERYPTTRELLRDLTTLRDHLSDVSRVTSPFPARSALFTAVAALAAAAALVFVFWVGRSSALRPMPAAPVFRHVTFQHGHVPSARFTPDGGAIIYGAAWEGRPVQLFTMQTGGSESRPLELPSANILSVSRSGELAISLHHRFVVGRETSGTLAQVPLTGGAPREVLDGVELADWAPDGKTLALVRDVGGKRRLEFPVGKALYETTGSIGEIRVSPRADAVAFMDHPLRGDIAGSLAVVDLAGRKKTLARGSGGFVGLAWTPDGNEIWFTAVEKIGYPELRAVTPSGRERLVLGLMGQPLILQDISRDGRALFCRSDWRRETSAGFVDSGRELNVSWLDWTFPVCLSRDGKTLLFREQGFAVQIPGVDWSEQVYVRGTDGSPAVRLGEGRALDLSPDGRWVLANAPRLTSSDLLLMPTGPGEPRKLSARPVACQSAKFLDGERILLSGSEQGKGSRLWILSMKGGPPRPLTPEGFSFYVGDPVSPDGRLVAARGPDRTFQLCPLEQAGAPRPIPGVSPEEQIAQWTRDGRSLYVYSASDLPAKIHVVDVSTGRRTLWKELNPADPAGVTWAGPVIISADGRTYAYSYRRNLEELYLADGLK